jgi:DNA repair protein RecO (recombination protein O)
MNETYRLTAIIFKRKPFREYDSQVALYTKEKGKIDLVARGTRKTLSKIAPHIEPLNFCEVMAVKGKAYDYIGSSISRKNYPEIKSDLRKLSAAGLVIGYLNKLIKKEMADTSIFDSLSEYLSLLGEIPSGAEDKEKTFSYLYLLRITNILGHKPELYDCLNCKQKINKPANRFYFSSGGLICNDCHINTENKRPGNLSHTPISVDAIKVMRFSLENGLEKLIKLKLSNNVKKQLEMIIVRILDTIVYA